MVTALWSKICHNWFIKCIFAGIVALCVLSLFAVFYYNPPIHIVCESGATDYTRESDKFWSRGTEGFAEGTTDDNGYNNIDDTSEDVDILMMGSSQTEGLYVDSNQNMSYVLSEMLYENNENSNVYNIGMSSHTFLRNVSNLENALLTYQPAEYVVLETDLVEFEAADVDAALQDQMDELETYDSGLLYHLQSIPYVKLAYQQYENYKGTDSDAEAIVESAVDNGYYDVAKTQEILGYVKEKTSEYGVTAIIYYYPHLYLEEDGCLATSRVEQKVANFAQICEDNGILFVDMTDSFLQEYEENQIIVSGFSNTAECYGHLNRYGHQLIAEALYQVISEN